MNKYFIIFNILILIAMRSIIYSLREKPITNLLKTRIFKEPINFQKTDNPEKQANKNINLCGKLHEDIQFERKISISQRKTIEDFNYIQSLPKLNNFGQFYRSKSFGLSSALCRHFSIKINPTMGSNKGFSQGGDFLEVVSGSSIFVDKSLFIKEIIEDKSKVILITMPRRWGKSLNMDMLRCFLSIEEQSPENKLKNREEFEKERENENGEKKKLDISETEIWIENKKNNNKWEQLNSLEIQGKYPVIFLDLKDCKGSSYEQIKRKLNDKIIKAIQEFKYLGKSKKEYLDLTTVGKQYRKILKVAESAESAESSIFEFTIRDLSELLHFYHGIKPWILIDEYDAALNEAYLGFNDEEIKQTTSLFRDVFETALKGNKSLERGVLTGVQYLVKSGLLSGLNNLTKYNITDTKYSKYYGIDYQEMEILTKHFNLDDETKGNIKHWYNGYKFDYGTPDKPDLVYKYNIWSIVNFLNEQNKGFRPYWENNTLNHFINSRIFKNKQIRDAFEKLILSKSLSIFKITNEFTLENFKELKNMINNSDRIHIENSGIDILLSYLFISGYLTIDPQSIEVEIPNREIEISIEEKLMEYYKLIFRISQEKIKILTNDLDSIFSENSIDKTSKILKDDFAPRFSSIIENLDIVSDEKVEETDKGLFANEDLMHSLLNSIAIQIVNSKFASERYTTKANGTKGRADIVLIKNKKGVVIEMKYNKNNKNNNELGRDQANKALIQARSYRELVKNTKTKIFIGCNVTDNKKVFFSGEIIEDNKTTHFVYPKIQ